MARGPCPAAQGEHMPRGARQPDMSLVFFYFFPQKKEKEEEEKEKASAPASPPR